MLLHVLVNPYPSTIVAAEARRRTDDEMYMVCFFVGRLFWFVFKRKGRPWNGKLWSCIIDE